MKTQKETSHVYQTGPSEAEACSGSSVQIQRRAPVAAADLVDFSASVQTPSFQPVSSPVSRIVSIEALFAAQYTFFPDVLIHLDRVL